MASYKNLLEAFGDADNLETQMRAAIVIAADQIRTEADTTPNHVNRTKWAAKATLRPLDYLDGCKWSVLAQKRALTKVQINSLTDADVLAAVLAAVDLLADGS